MRSANGNLFSFAEKESVEKLAFVSVTHCKRIEKRDQLTVDGTGVTTNTGHRNGSWLEPSWPSSVQYMFLLHSVKLSMRFFCCKT